MFAAAATRGDVTVLNAVSYTHLDVYKRQEWNQAPEAMDIRNFYGGDLQGVLDKLDYLQDLGVEVIYLSLIHI